MPLGNLLQGYEAARKGNLAESGQELQQFGSLQSILAQQQALQEQAKIRALISGGGSPEQIVQGLLQSGPNGAAAAHQYATAIKELGTAKAIQGLSGADLTNSDVLLKASLIPGMGHLGPEAERLRKVKENAAALATYREAPQPMPVGTPVPGTTMQTTAAIPPEERAAFDKVAQAAAQGQVASAAPQPGDISRAPKAGGLFADLMSSEFPAIANQAKTMQAQLNASGAALPAQHWIDLKSQLATREAGFIQAKSMQDSARAGMEASRQTAPHPVIGVDEKGNQVVTWVTPSQGAQTLPTKPPSTVTSANQQALRLKSEYLSLPVVKEASAWDTRIVPVATFMATRANADNAAKAVGDNALIKAYVTAVRPTGARTDMSTNELSKLPGLESRIQAAIANFALGRHLPDSIAAEMWSNISTKYKTMNKLRDNAKVDITKRAKTMGVNPEAIFSAESPQQ